MSKNNTALAQLINFISYTSLQIAIGQIIIPLHRASCFVYIGFFLLLPWQRTSLILQLFLGFLVGMMIDAFYDKLGIHAFAAVLLVYFRNFLLHILLPSAAKDHKYGSRPTLRNMGVKRFSVYALVLIFIYHTVVFFLDAWSIIFFFTALPQLILSIVLSYFFTISPLALFTVVSNTYRR